MDYLVKFPDPRLADDDGLIAVGGELTPEYLISAYASGIFPWFSEGDPVLWWSPNPRLVLYPDNFKISKSLLKTYHSKKFEVKIDHDFRSIISNCSKMARPGQEGTWITEDMVEAYCRLHEIGLVHSFEAYIDNKLAGGLYGVSLGRAFFGESMFFKERDASKIAFFHLVEWCKNHDFHFIDAQQPTNHLKSLGAQEIERDIFLEELEKALQFDTLPGKWTF